MLEVLTMVSECSVPALGLALKAIKNLLSVIQIIVPIVLMCAVTFHLIKMMQNPDEKKNFSKVKNSFLAAAIIFFIPVLINMLMNILGEDYNVSLCWNNIQDNGINTEQGRHRSVQTLHDMSPLHRYAI
jgi:NADH:ubiquinone oxidoreductase subunit 6 (subunit J)